MRELHLFAGAGGGILGGMLLGHTPVGAVEIDPFARAVLHARQADGSLPDFPIYDDVRTFDGTQWRDRVDIIAGGFPCQDLSVAGKGAGIDGARSGLWWEMLRVIREARPRYVFLENVPAITGRGLDRVLGSLADLGLDAEWLVLSAADAGAPHLRKRWWCLARDTARNDADALAGISQRQDPEPAGNGGILADSQSARCATGGHRSRSAADGSILDLQPQYEGPAMADSASRKDGKRGRGGMDGSESSGEGLDASAGVGCANAADTDGERCEKRHAEERRVSEFDANRDAMADAAERSGPADAAATTDANGERQTMRGDGQTGTPSLAFWSGQLRGGERDSGKGCPRSTGETSSGPAHTDTDGRRCEEQRQPQQPDMQCEPRDEPDGLRSRGQWQGAPGCAEGLAETEPRMGRAADGLAAWLDAGRRLQASAWKEGWEDDCPRVVFGKPANRTNRLKALGNGQVPQTAAAAFRILWERLHR